MFNKGPLLRKVKLANPWAKPKERGYPTPSQSGGKTGKTSLPRERKTPQSDAFAGGSSSDDDSTLPGLSRYEEKLIKEKQSHIERQLEEQRRAWLGSGLRPKVRLSAERVVQSFASGVLLLGRGRLDKTRHYFQDKRYTVRLSKNWSLLKRQPNLAFARQIAAVSTRTPNQVRSIWGIPFPHFVRKWNLLAHLMSSHYPLFFKDNDRLQKRLSGLLGKHLAKLGANQYYPS